MIHRAGICLAPVIAGWSATPASAADTLKLAVGQREIWHGAPAALGERAGIFRKHDLDLELLFTSGSGETMQAVIAGSVDIGIAAGTLGVMGAYAKGAPVRIIGAESLPGHVHHGDVGPNRRRLVGAALRHGGAA